MRRWSRAIPVPAWSKRPPSAWPAVNIGSRQAGRILCRNVLSCPGDAAAIEAALRTALTPEFAAKAKGAQSPYNGGDTSGKIAEILRAYDFSKPKTFYDAP